MVEQPIRNRQVESSNLSLGSSIRTARVKSLLKFLAGVLLFLPLPAFGQQIAGRFYPEKQSYLVGEPVIVVLELTNTSTAAIRIEHPTCPMLRRFEAPTAAHPRGVSLYGCEGGGFGGDCASGLPTLPPEGRVEERILLDGPFRFDSPGVYPVDGQQTVHFQTDPDPHRPMTGFEVISDFEVTVRAGSDAELSAAYQPILGDLESKNYARRAVALGAVVQQPPRSLESVVLKLADDPQTVYAAISGLKRLGTPAAKEKLATIAADEKPNSPRGNAVEALGELGDQSYCNLMLDIASQRAGDTQNTALRAAGYLCRESAIPMLAGLLPGAEGWPRGVIATALGNTDSRQAVALLIPLLLEGDEYVRRAASGALATLTHRRAHQDVRGQAGAIQAHADWLRRWASHGSTALIFSICKCGETQPID